MSINICKKFLVLKTNIIEQENNLRHQIFRRKRYRILIEAILDFMSVLDIMNMLKLNKNISNIIKEKNYLSKIPTMKHEFFVRIQKTLRYNNFPKVFQIDQINYSETTDDMNLKRIVLPIYFAKKYLINRNYETKFYELSLGMIGGELLSYYIKLSNSDLVEFEKVRDIESLLAAHYFPECTNISTLIFKEVSFYNHKSEPIKNIFLLKNLRTLKISQGSFYSTSVNILCHCLIDTNSRVETLSLTHNKIGGECGIYFEQLIKNDPHLLHLYLDYNEINGAGFVSIGSAIDINSNLETLSMTRNVIKDSDAKDFFLALWKNRPKSLKNLILNQNLISKKGLKMAGKFIKRKDCPLEYISILNNRYSSSDAIKFVGKIKPFTKLNKIGLLYNYSVTTELETFLNQLNEAYELNIKLDKRV